jgi:hypothetical protein
MAKTPAPAQAILRELRSMTEDELRRLHAQLGLAREKPKRKRRR